MEKIKVGYVDNSYSSDRQFLQLDIKNIEYKRIYDFTLPYRALRKIGFLNMDNFRYKRFFENYFHDFGLNNVDLVHLYNRLSLSRAPWVFTYVSMVPYWDPRTDREEKIYHKYGFELLYREACRKIIAPSHHAREKQLLAMKKEGYSTSELEEKFTVLHPAQELLVNNWEEKKLSVDGDIVLTIVGHQFFVKGGKELLIVVERLIQEGYPVKLNVVSNLMMTSYGDRTEPEDVTFAKSIIQKYDAITWYKQLPNNQVLQLYKKSHLGILISYSETYGYSLLEAQAAGCPVISTDIRVFPENNNEETGWLLKMPKGEIGRAKISTEEERKRYSDLLMEQLYDVLVDIFANRDQIKIKGNKSLERIGKDHNPVDRANKLGKIYKEALKFR